ncbi:hypothetical protein Tco_0408103 [Tanacetum coccineum]
MADKEAKSTTRKIVANDQAYYYLGITCIMVNGKNAYELKGKLLDDLHKKPLVTMDIFTKGALWDYWKLGSDETEPSNDETSDLKETDHDYEQEINFEGLTPDMRHDLAERLRMVYTGNDGQEFFSTCRIGDEIGLDVAGTLCFQLGGARRSMTWRQFILALGLHTAEEMAEDGFRAYWLGSERVIPDKGDLSDYWVEISYGKDVLRGAPLYTYIRDPVWRLCHRHAKGRKSCARLSGGHFIRHLAHHFGLVSPGPERQQVAAAGALRPTEDDTVLVEGAQVIPQPVKALNDSELKEEALRNKAIIEGMIDDNNESSNNGWRRWDGYEIADHDQEEK